MTCQHPGTNHSDDTFTVYHGADPLELCGYHAGRGVQAALDAIADAAAKLGVCNCLDCSDTPLEQRPAPLEAR